MEWILNALITAMPITIGPTVNVAILTKTKNILKTPIDFGKNFIDNKRIFGNNKTWKGLILSVLICSVISIIWGIICNNIPSLEERNWFYRYNENTVLYNLFIGALLGLAYSLFELPNSFIKRRIEIAPGQTSKTSGKIKIIFSILDNFDSSIGTMLVIWYFCKLTLLEYMGLVIMASIIHYLIVFAMYKLKIKEAR